MATQKTSRKSKLSAEESVEELFAPATDAEPAPKNTRKRTPKAKVESVEVEVEAKPKTTTRKRRTKKTDEPVVEVVAEEAKTKTKKEPKEKKETEAQKERRELKEFYAAFTKTEAENQKEWFSGIDKKLGREPDVKDFKYRARRKKNVWDGRLGMWIAKDPCQVYGDYPDDFLPDPVTKVVLMRHTKSKENNPDVALTEEIWKADRRRYIKSTRAALLKLDLEDPKQKKTYETASNNLDKLMPVEYFAVSAEKGIVVLVSFGADGATPIDLIEGKDDKK